MKTLKAICIAIVLCATFGCVYYYIESEGCAYCEEKTLHFISGPLCEGDAQTKRAWIDSMQVQGARLGQVWICEIR